MRAYEYKHVVGFEETNLIGNVYYANHVRWQGRCREMFLRDRAPEVIEALKHGLVMVTTRVSCEFMAELVAFDEALKELEELSQRQSRVVELRYFGGLSVEETATVLKVSPETVMRDWTMAKTWLHRALSSTSEV
jgi:DNA-directed RNA polymerase specialized sigma24 family protein